MRLASKLPLYRGVFAAAAVAAAIFLTLILSPLIEPGFYPFFLAAVFLTAWFHGRAAGLTAAALSLAAILYFFVTPLLTWRAETWPDIWRATVFTGTALLITWLASGWRESRALLSSTLSSITDAVAVTDNQHRVQFLNSVGEALTGWRFSEARRKPLDHVFRAIYTHDRQRIPNPMAEGAKEGAANLVSTALLLTRDGAEVLIEYSAAPIRNQRRRIVGGVLVFRDISARRRIEEQLGESRKMEAVSRLAGGVAGDFNNLLTVITGYSELLRSELSGNAGMRKFADEIYHASERAAGLARQLLAFSSSTVRQPRLLDVNALLADMEPVLKRVAGDKVRVTILPSQRLGRVQVDAGQFEEAILNLASNASEAMEGGGKLTLETSQTQIDEGASSKIGVPPGEYVLLAVSDTGKGMDAATRSRLFEPFFTTKQPGRGAGLGLSTVYGFVKQSEGHITVFSQPGAGTIFEIYLPKATEEVEVLRRKAAAANNGSETILLVDDEEGIRKLVSSILTSHGYTTIEAADGVAALEAFEKNAHKIDLVLTDVVMPRMDGYELGQKLRSTDAGVKILFMSGYRDTPESAGLERAAFVHKPFTPDSLLARVRDLLDRERRQAN